MDGSAQKDSGPLRPLLPAPAGQRPETGTSRRPVRVNACEACRARKSKCDGGKPSCRACNSRETECRYGRTEARQIRQRYQQLKDRRTAQEELFDMLQTMTERDAADVFRRIREGGNAEAIVQHVQEGNLVMELSGSPETRIRYEFPYIGHIPTVLRESIYFRSKAYDAIQATDQSAQGTLVRSIPHESNYTHPLLAAELIDPLLADAKPSKWTRVSSNDALSRKLMEAYFKYEYPWRCIFNKDDFLEDMVSGGNRFCSALLVNALLAKACTCSRILSNSTKFWDPDTLTYRFLAEAKRLWELEEGEPKLTTIHAGCLISAAMDVIGHDKPGLDYTLKALSIANAMGVFHAPQPDNSHGKSVFYDRKFEDAKAFTAWGLLSWLTFKSYYYFKPPYLPEPPQHRLPDVESNPKWYGEIWLRYPFDQTLFPINHGHHMKAQCELRAIMHEICAVSFRLGCLPMKMPWQQALAFQARLQDWYETLPAVLSPLNLLYPSHLNLHCEYHSTLIILFESQLSSADGNGEILSDKQHYAARDIIDQAAHQLESLIRLYYLRHGFEAYDSLHLVFLAHLANVALTHLARIEDDAVQKSTPRDRIEALRSTLILCLKGLHDQSKNFYIAGVVLNVFKNQLSSANRDLVGRFVTLNDLEEDQEANDYHHPIISDYVIPGVNLNEDPQAARLENMVHEFGGPWYDE